MNNESQLQQICHQKNLNYEQVLALMELYNSDEDEEVLLAQIHQYPEPERELVTDLLLGSAL